MYYRLFLCTCFWCQFVYVFAQTDIKHQQPDSIYVTSYRHLLNISTGLQTNNAEFIVAYPKNNLRFELSPRETLQQFLLFQYKWINFRYSFTPSYLNPDRSMLTGKNTRSSFDVFMAVKNIDIAVSHQKSIGYYVKNTRDILASWKPGDPYLQLPNLATKMTSIEFAYNVNKKFSDVGMISGKSKQIKHAWSFLPALSFSYTHFYDPAIQPLAGQHSEDYNFDVNLKLPLGASLVWAKDWSVAATAGPVIGVNFFRTDTYDQSLNQLQNKETRLSTGYWVQSGLSYTRDRWYTGLDAYTYQYGSGTVDSRTRRFFYGLELYIGKRFNAPALLKKLL